MVDLYTESGRLSARAPFDFAKTLAFAQGFYPARRDQRIDGDSLTRALMVHGQPVGFRVWSEGTLEAPQLGYTLYAEQPLSAEQREAIVDRVGFFLSLDDDLEPFYEIGHDDPSFAHIINDLYGYHQLKFLTPFENAVWAVLSQRNQMPVTRRMKQAISDHYGGQIVIDEIAYSAFPEPDRLAVAPPDEVSKVIHHGPKGQLLPGVAQAFDRMDEHWLRDAPSDEVERWLQSIRGIGDWSAAFILLRGLGRMNRLPAGDRWIAGAVAKVYGLGAGADDVMVERLGRPYGEWIGYWAHYLRAAT